MRTADEFFSSVTPEGSCLVWTKYKNRCGYGWVNWCGVSRLAHRVAWFLARGRWPDLFLLHSCDNPACVRIEHLREGTARDNILDMHARGRARTSPRQGRWNRGEGNGHSKLTWEQVREIRRQRAAGTRLSAISRAYNVNRQTVSNIVHNRSWKEE
jgi:hypothetical protein